MSVRIRYSIEASVSSTTAEAKDLGNVAYSVVDDSFGEGGTWKTKVASGATDVQVYLNNIAAVGVLIVKTNAVSDIETPVTVTLKLNSALGEAIDVVPLVTSKEGHFLLSANNVSALYASNAGSVDMEVTVVAAGD